MYSTCKAGVIAPSKSIARETGRYGLRVNVVCPGLLAPPQEESIIDASIWNQMGGFCADDVPERVEQS